MARHIEGPKNSTKREGYVIGLGLGLTQSAVGLMIEERDSMTEDKFSPGVATNELFTHHHHHQMGACLGKLGFVFENDASDYSSDQEYEFQRTDYFRVYPEPLDNSQSEPV